MPRKVRSDPLPVLGRFLSTDASPSSDLYLSGCCADLLESGALERHASTVFRFERTLIVVRHDGGLETLPAHDRLIYVIDDDWRSGLTDRNIPAWYRGRLFLREARAAVRLEPNADVIVVSSDVLALVYRARFPLKRIVVVEPAWAGPEAPAATDLEERKLLRLAVLGAATHRRDALWLTPVLTAILEARPSLQILWSTNHSLPKPLAGNIQVVQIPAMDWVKYQEWIARTQADIGLYPLIDGPFNRARSINKLCEYDRLGAAVVGSNNWDAAEEAEKQGACLLLPMDIREWIDRVLDLIDHPVKIEQLAHLNRLWLSTRGLSRQRMLWEDILPVSGLNLSNSGTYRSHGEQHEAS